MEQPINNETFVEQTMPRLIRIKSHKLNDHFITTLNLRSNHCIGSFIGFHSPLSFQAYRAHLVSPVNLISTVIGLSEFTKPNRYADCFQSVYISVDRCFRNIQFPPQILWPSRCLTIYKPANPFCSLGVVPLFHTASFRSRLIQSRIKRLAKKGE